MRKLWLIILIIVVAGVFVFFRYGRGTGAQVNPEIFNITSSQATVAWLSEKEYKGQVFYQPAGGQIAPLSATETFGASKLHEVVLTGLLPASRYSYWVNNSDSRFQFQTQPTANDPFSFLVVWGNISDRIASLTRSESAEFIISLTGESRQNFDQFSNVRAYLPVYNLNSVDSPFLKTTAGKSKNSVNDLWKLDWGGLRLIFIGKSADAAKITNMLNTPAAHTIGIIINSSDVVGELEAKKISETVLHSVLAAHNKQHPTKPAAFAAVIGKEANDVEVDGIQYFGIGTANKNGAIRIDVDVESTRAVFVDDNKEIALKQPPIKQKRTCEECRRLADKGAYEESIKAYLEFIETHKDGFQIDDAYFAITDIYDSKLFDFNKALEWYRRLIAEYPDGTFTSLANQRIKYISAYSDYDYKPLASFERIKAIEYARKKEILEERNRIFGEVESLINEYPDSNIAPVMQHWLANQYRLSDPDKAVKAYMTLRKNYGNHREAQESMLEIGETYYDAARYKESIVAFNEAINQLPALADTIKAQIARAERNLRRDKIANVCWAILAIIFVIAFLKKPRLIDSDRISWCAATFIIMFALLSFGAWLVREQFNSAQEMSMIVLFFSLTTSLSMSISVNLANKLLKKRKAAFAATVGSLAGIIFFLAGVYLTLYCVYVHYLIVVKL